MPLLVKDYTWSENENEVIIDIPLKGTKKKVDIFSTDIYLKVSIHENKKFLDFYKRIMQSFDKHALCQQTNRCFSKLLLRILFPKFIKIIFYK